MSVVSESFDVPPDREDADENRRAERLFLAFQYVTGDLGDIEAEKFEEALGSDDQWCELVVEATRLVSALSATCDEFHGRLSERTKAADGHIHRLSDADFAGRRSQEPSGRALTAVALMVSMIACVMLVGATLMVEPDARIRLGQSIDSGHASQSGATAIGQVTELLALYTRDSPDQSAGVYFEDDERLSFAELAEISVPDWMVAAVRLEGEFPANQGESPSGVGETLPELNDIPGGINLNQLGSDRRSPGTAL